CRHEFCRPACTAVLLGRRIRRQRYEPPGARCRKHRASAHVEALGVNFSGGYDCLGMSASRIAPLHAAGDPCPPFASWNPDEAAKGEKRHPEGWLRFGGAWRNSVSSGPMGFFLVLGEKIGF